MQRQMDHALRLETRFCLSGRQGHRTRHPPCLGLELTTLVERIVGYRKKRIAERAAVRRWLWPCCSMSWEEFCDHGLPPEADFLACGARLEEKESSLEGHAVVGLQDDVVDEEARGWPEERGEDCGQRSDCHFGHGKISERELLLLMAGDGVDDAWSEPSWDAPCEPVQAHFEPTHRNLPDRLEDSPFPPWGLGPLPSRCDESEDFVCQGHRSSGRHSTVNQAEPSSPWVLGFRPLPPVCAELPCSQLPPSVAEVPWPFKVLGSSLDQLPSAEPSSPRVLGFRPLPPVCAELPCSQLPPSVAEVPWPSKVFGPSPDQLPSAEMIPQAAQIPWPCGVLDLASVFPSALLQLPSLRVGGGPGLEGLLEGIVSQLMPMITEMIQKAIAEALGKGLVAEDGNPAARADISTAEPRLKRHKGGGRDPKRKSPETTEPPTGRGAPRAGNDTGPSGNRRVVRGKGAGGQPAAPSAPVAPAAPAD